MARRRLRFSAVGAVLTLGIAVLPTVPAGAAAASLAGAPTAVSAAALDRGALVSWTPPSNTGGTAITGYVITASPGGLTTTTLKVKSFTVGGLTDGTAYQFTVAAINAVGTGPASSASAAVTPMAPTVPGAVRSVKTTGGFAQATVSWSPPLSDGGAPVSGYQVTASPGGATVSATGDARSAAVAGLTNGVSYILALQALNSVGAGPAVNSAAVTPGVTKPGPVSSVQAAPTGSGVLVSWQPPADDGGSAVTRYLVTASPGGTRVTAGAAASSATVTGLTAGTAYTFVVVAANALGQGLPSTSTPATPNATVAPTTVVLSAASLAALVVVHTDGSMQFTSPPAQVTSLTAGDIVAAGVSPATPDGLLAQVTSVTTSGTTTTVPTTPASLDQALSKAGFGTEGTLTAGQVASFTPARPGVRLAAPASPAASAGSLTLSLDTDLYKDKLGRKVTVTGTASVTPQVSLSASITCCVHTASHFTASVATQASLTVDAQLTHEISGGYTLGTVRFNPIDIQVGPIPVILVPTLTITLVANGSATVGLSASVGERATLGVDLTTTDASVTASPIKQFTSTFTPPTVYGSIAANAGVQARITVSIEGVAGPYLQDTLWPFELSASSTANPWWKLSLENQIGVGFKLSVLGHTLTDWKNDSLLDYRYTLATAKGPFQQVVVTPNPARVAPGATVQLKAKVVGAIDQTVTWLAQPSGGMVTTGGLYTAPTVSGHYQVTVTSPAAELKPAAVGIADVIVGSQPPGSPTAVTAAAGGIGQAKITWAAPTDTGGAPITGYTIAANPGATSYPATTTSTTINGLTGGATYTFTVTATTAGSTSLPSAPSNSVNVNDVPIGGGVVTIYPGISQPQGITAGPDGALWFTNQYNNSIGRITTAGAVTNYTGADINNPQGITAGPDGALWFTNQYNNSIGRITTAGSVTNYTGAGINGPYGITAGPDGALWFTNLFNNSIGRITTAGVVTNYTGAGINGPYGITAGPDGALWFTNPGNSSIGRITTAGVVTNYTGTGINGPNGITAGPDGALWFTNSASNSIGRITTAGVVTNYTRAGINGPYGITAGPDGALWFINSTDSSIGRITTAGAVTNYTGAGINGPEDITAGPDGALWFTNYGTNSIGRITTAGAVTNYTGAGINGPYGITAGPDGALWFTNPGNSSIGRITTAGAVTNYTGTVINGIVEPKGITAGPDGALWFTNYGYDSIGRITTAGVVTTHAGTGIRGPNEITAGPDGALWFTNINDHSIGRITTAGAVTDYTGAGIDGINEPNGITAGPDGALWFTNQNSIGRITTAGAVTNYTGAGIFAPGGITAGPDGALWFTDYANSIGRITVAG